MPVYLLAVCFCILSIIIINILFPLLYKSFTLFIVQSYLACSLALICCMSPFRCGEDSQISRLCYRPTLMLLH